MRALILARATRLKNQISWTTNFVQPEELCRYPRLKRSAAREKSPVYLSTLSRTGLVPRASVKQRAPLRTEHDRSWRVHPERTGRSTPLRQSQLLQTLRRRRNTSPQTDPFLPLKESREGIASLSLSDCFAATIDSPPLSVSNIQFHFSLALSCKQFVIHFSKPRRIRCARILKAFRGIWSLSANSCRSSIFTRRSSW